MIYNKLSFEGRIQFVNKESYKNFIGYRKNINDLKYHCGNKQLTHFIQHDDNFFVITTSFEHEKKIDGTTSHAISDVLSYPNEFSINKTIKKHIEEIKDWKARVDSSPNQITAEAFVLRKENVFARIFKNVQKFIEKCLQKKNVHV